MLTVHNPASFHTFVHAARIDALFTVVVFRALPFVAHGIVASRLSIVRRIWWAGLFVSSLVVGQTFGFRVRDIAFWSGLAFIYFIPVAILTHLAARRVWERRLRRRVVAAGLFAACIVMPGLSLSQQVLGPAIVWGFELMLSGYSYCADNERATSFPDIREGLFFLLVNPAIVYAQRGREWLQPRSFIWGAARCMVGLAAWVAANSLAALIVSLPITAVVHNHYYTPFFYCARFFPYYWAHSALASLLIGFAAVSGHRIPERYNLPFVARTPVEFWKRWNIWVSQWTTRYIFFAMGVRIRRRASSAKIQTLGAGLAVLLTFTFMGVLHDIVNSAGHSFEGFLMPHWALFRGTIMFLWFGLTLIVWHAADRPTQRRSANGSIGRAARACAVVGLLLAGHAVSEWFVR
jgi:hypothetical protein